MDERCLLRGTNKREQALGIASTSVPEIATSLGSGDGTEVVPLGTWFARRSSYRRPARPAFYEADSAFRSDSTIISTSPSNETLGSSRASCAPSSSRRRGGRLPPGG